MANCDWCNDSGLVTAYHRQYRGDTTVHVEEVDRAGEVRLRKMPGIIAAHCSCPLGVWTRAQLADDLVRRIPSFADILKGRYYQFEDPRGEDDREGELNESAKAFLRRWKRGLGIPVKEAPKPRRMEPEEIANALRERAAKERSEA